MTLRAVSLGGVDMPFFLSLCLSPATERSRVTTSAEHPAALARVSHEVKRIGAANQRKLLCPNDFTRFAESPDADRV